MSTWAVVPAFNEGPRIKQVVRNLSKLTLDQILVVVNGSKGGTLAQLLCVLETQVKILYFPEPLGIDIPRAAGAKFARDRGAKSILFVDGDMGTVPLTELDKLIAAVRDRSVDLALTDCYPSSSYHYPTGSIVAHYRRRLNEVAGLFLSIGIASPCHGPHGISDAFLNKIPLLALGKPPLAQAIAAKSKLHLQVAAKIPHLQLGSPDKGRAHSQRITDTIVGDCLEAISLLEGKPLTRSDGRRRYEGYNRSRRWDILYHILTGAYPLIPLSTRRHQ